MLSCDTRREGHCYREMLLSIKCSSITEERRIEV